DDHVQPIMADGDGDFAGDIFDVMTADGHRTGQSDLFTQGGEAAGGDSHQGLQPGTHVCQPTFGAHGLALHVQDQWCGAARELGQVHLRLNTDARNLTHQVEHAFQLGACQRLVAQQWFGQGLQTVLGGACIALEIDPVHIAFDDGDLDQPVAEVLVLQQSEGQQIALVLVDLGDLGDFAHELGNGHGSADQRFQQGNDL